MSDQEKVIELKRILIKQLELYRKYTEEEKRGEVDGSYIYDMAYEWFNDLGRKDFQSILKILEEK